jgi:RNA polymerase sigma factor (sigma-70 family)
MGMVADRKTSLPNQDKAEAVPRRGFTTDAISVDSPNWIFGGLRLQVLPATGTLMRRRSSGFGEWHYNICCACPSSGVDGRAMSATAMIEQDRQIAEVIAEQSSRLRSFIRRRVPNESDVDDLLQEVFYELVVAHRLMMPIDYVTGWLYRVARNRITDLFRKKKPETFADAAMEDEEGVLLRIEDLLPSPDAGPEADYFRKVLFAELEVALGELPGEQRAVFIAHEIEGRSFKEMSAESGLNVNTLLARKRYAVLHLRQRLQRIHDEFNRK